MSNMALWDSVRVTDPHAVKPITGKTYKGDSPKPYWLIQRATEVFGPIGIGWGVTVKSERFERMTEHEVLHVAIVSIWYVLDGKRSESFDQMGGTKACYLTSKGSYMVDEDAGKKSVTDGMVKCLSMIGFAGDIFSGMWNDSKYVQWAAEETARRESVGSEIDMSPKARAERIEVGVTNGDAAGAAEVLSQLNEDALNSIWVLLSPDTQEQLTAAWPKG